MCVFYFSLSPSLSLSLLMQTRMKKKTLEKSVYGDFISINRIKKEIVEYRTGTAVGRPFSLSLSLSLSRSFLYGRVAMETAASTWILF